MYTKQSNKATEEATATKVTNSDWLENSGIGLYLGIVWVSKGIIRVRPFCTLGSRVKNRMIQLGLTDRTKKWSTC